MCPNGSLDREGIEQLYAMPRRLIIAMILIIANMVIIAKMLTIKKMLVITKMLIIAKMLVIKKILIITKMLIIKKMLVIKKMMISTITLVLTIYDGLSFVLHRNAKVFIDQMFRLFDRDGNGKIGFRVMSKFCPLV